MSFRISTKHIASYAYYVPEGHVSLVALFELIDLIKRDFDQHEKTQILVDCGSITGRLSLADLYAFGTHAARKLGSKIRLAFLDSHQWLDGQFTETVVANRGGNLRCFRNADKAMDWFSVGSNLPEFPAKYYGLTA